MTSMQTTPKAILQAQHSIKPEPLTIDLLRDQYRRTKIPWEDPDFPAVTKSVYPSTPNRKIEWKRPNQLCDSPKLFTGGVERFDIQQGELGDCWVLAAVASLSMHKQLFENVVIPGQGFDSEYCGAFQFRLWQFGKWVDVLVDDRLPVERNKLMFMHSYESDEYWSALLEKAYAKVNGSYEALIGGSQAEAMEDFTGGLCETVDLTDPKVKASLFDKMLRYANMSSLMGCSIDAEDGNIEGELPNGLIVGHAYTVTDVKQLNLNGQPLQLVRIRNPWGDAAEWNGPYSDGSKEWKQISMDDRKKLDLVFDDDGEFWMTYQDFVANYTKLEICHLGPDSLESPDLGTRIRKMRWEANLEDSAWQKNVNAGGCRNFIETFWTNPQFVIEVLDPDDDDDENNGTIIVGLMQKDMRKKKVDFWTIGYAIYKIGNNVSGTLPKRFFQITKMAEKSPQFINQREVVGRHKLEPGKYVIVPSTFNANEEATFILRIYSQKACESGTLEDKTLMGDPKIKLSIDQKMEEERRIESIKQVYNKISGPTGLITATQLANILNVGLQGEIPNFKGFSNEVCRSLVALKDVDLSGRLEFEEFIDLWSDLRIWKKIFTDFDTDRSGSFNATELRLALTAAGFSVNNKLFQVLAYRYTHAENGNIAFEDYILMIARLKNAFETFKAQPKDRDNNAQFVENEFLRYTLYV